MVSARAAILARIRSALAQPLPLPEKPAFDGPVHPPLPTEDLAVVFAANFQRIGGEFYYCEDLTHFAAQLAVFRTQQPALASPYVWEPALQQLLTKAGVSFRSGEDDFRKNADLSLTSCEALVARTGSVLVSAATASGRRLSIYPDQHLVLAHTAQIVAEIGNALRLMQAKYSPAGLPSMISLTTGPSRTADIEKTLVLGAHGPRRLVLFLLDDEPAADPA